MSLKKYRISQLAEILQVTEPAIRKKIKTEGNTKLYRNRFEIVSEFVDGKQISFILMSDEDLEQEKQLAKRNKNKFYQQNVMQNDIENVEDTEYIDVLPEKLDKETVSENSYITFTKLYMERMENIYKEVIEAHKQVNEKDKQIYLLEDLSKREKQDMFELQATNKTLLMKIEKLKITLIVLITTVIICSLPIGYLIFKYLSR